LRAGLESNAASETHKAQLICRSDQRLGGCIDRDAGVSFRNLFAATECRQAVKLRRLDALEDLSFEPVSFVDCEGTAHDFGSAPAWW
jgi:hypothetical protein